MYGLSSRSGQQLHNSCRQPRSACITRAASGSRSPFGGQNDFNFGVLAHRIQQAKRADFASKAKAARPDLPKNVKTWDEVDADHRLICNWHENAWSQVRDVLTDKER